MAVEQVAVIPSFLPPSQAEHNTAPPASFEQLKRRYPTIICFNAFAPSLYNNEDLYGGDILLEAFADVARDFSDVGLYMVYVGFDVSPLAQRLRAAATKLGDRVVLEERFDGPFVPILLNSSLAVRATSNDGGPSISVLESLALGIWCAASDAVPRPAECVLFRNRDAQDLARALRTILEKVQRNEHQPPVHFPDAAEALLPLYQSLQ